MKTILVIGGGSGIGKQVVLDLLDKDYSVIAASRSVESADDLPESVKRIQFDATSDDELEIPNELDGLVYCPGTINLRPFERISVKDIQQELEVNYLGAVRVLKQVIRSLKKAESASVVLFSTVAVQTGMPYHSSISAAKGAVEGLVRSLAAEYAPSIRFNAVAPSLTDTPLAEGLLSNDKKREANANRHPLKKVGTPSDISKIVTYLVSSDSSWVTGQVLTIDGGMSALRTL